VAKGLVPPDKPREDLAHVQQARSMVGTKAPIIEKPPHRTRLAQCMKAASINNPRWQCSSA
jgi:hypothetical protein